MLHSRGTLVALVVLVLLASGCARIGGSGNPRDVATPRLDRAVDLDGTEWVLASLNGHGLIEGTNITLSFSEGVVSGFAGCNAYDGSFFDFEPPVATEMACGDPVGVMEQERRYLDWLEDVAAYGVDGGELWLETDNGRALIFRARAEGSGMTDLVEDTPTKPAQPAPTPGRRDCGGPGAFPTEEAELIWPTLVQVQPSHVTAGDEVEMLGVGGHLYWDNECGEMWVESARDFHLFFDGKPAGFVTCYASNCRANLAMPADAPLGAHSVSVEGGSNLSIEVVGEATPSG